MTGAAGLRTGFALAALACLAGAGACLWLRPETLALAAPAFAALAALAFAALAVQSRRRARFAAEIEALRQRLESGAAPSPGAPPPPIHALEQLVLARFAAAGTALAAAQAEQARLQARSREDGESRDAEARAARTAMATLSEALKAVAGGDLTLRLAGTLPPESAAAGQKFDQAVTLVTKAMLAFATSLGAIRAQSRGIWGGARKLARRGEARANAMGAAARTLQAAAQALQGEAAQAAAARAALGDIVPTLTASVSGARAGGAALEGFVGAAGRIADITALIDDVSFQTNLLALNAGVEAARAGEAGRGIAVVAQELRALSARSTQAAKDLSALLNTALREARASSGGVLQAAQALEALAPRAEAVERFAVATSEQGARRAGEFAALARELEGLVVDAAQDQTLIGEANEAGAALEALLGKLAGLVAHFRFEHDDFGFDAAMPDAPDEADDPPPIRQAARLAARRPTLALADRRRAGL